MIQALELIERYYQPYTTAYRILRTHSEQVAKKAVAIATRLNETHSSELIDLDFIAEAALLHDIGIYAVYAPQLGCFGQHPYLQHGVIGAQLLRAEKLPKHAQVCERHIGVGLTANEIIAQKLPLPAQDYLPRTIEEQIITYADLFFSKNPNKLTQEKTSATVRKTVASYGEEKGIIFDQWQQRFGK